MALHVQVRRRGDLLCVTGQWDTKLPLFQGWTVPTIEGQTAAETVELEMMDLNMVATWPWSKRTDGAVLEGEFSRAPSHKEVTDSGADRYDI